MAFLTDSSTNNFQLTAFGNAQISTSEKKYGDGSAYFDGSGDYLTTTNNGSFDFGTGDFTVEFWMNSSGFVTDVHNFFSGNQFQFGYDCRVDERNFYIWDGSSKIVTASFTLSFNTWYHVAYVRSGNTLTIFLNGQFLETVTYTGSVNIGNPIYVGIAGGSQGNSCMFGYIDDLRITKGIARYTSNFTPPDAQLPIPSDLYGDDVSLLLHMNDLSGSTTFIDSSTNNFQLTAFGNVQISTVTKKFGNGAAYFDGSGDYLITPQSQNLEFLNDFTVEFWLYPLAFTTDMCLFDSLVLNGIGSRNDAIAFLTNTSGLYYLFTSASVVGTSSSGPSLNQWNHIALVRSGSTIKVYNNGNEVLSINNSTNFSSGGCIIGTISNVPGNPSYALNGYIDELRITKGVARYTSNFVPQTAPFANPVPPPIPSGYLAFWKLSNVTDSSPNENTLTDNGGVQFVAGKIGNCADFNGSNYLSSTQGVPTGDFTLSYWLKLNSFTADQVVGQLAFGCAFFGSGSDIYFANDSSALVQIIGPVNLGQWNHVVVTRSGNTFDMWTNGVLRNTQISNVVSSSSQMQFGTGHTCQIDAFGIWSRSLTTEEIAILYNNGNGIE